LIYYQNEYQTFAVIERISKISGDRNTDKNNWFCQLQTFLETFAVGIEEKVQENTDFLKKCCRKFRLLK